MKIIVINTIFKNFFQLNKLKKFFLLKIFYLIFHLI